MSCYDSHTVTKLNKAQGQALPLKQRSWRPKHPACLRACDKWKLKAAGSQAMCSCARQYGRAASSCRNYQQSCPSCAPSGVSQPRVGPSMTQYSTPPGHAHSPAIGLRGQHQCSTAPQAERSFKWHEETPAANPPQLASSALSPTPHHVSYPLAICPVYNIARQSTDRDQPPRIQQSSSYSDAPSFSCLPASAALALSCPSSATSGFPPCGCTCVTRCNKRTPHQRALSGTWPRHQRSKRASRQPPTNHAATHTRY